MRHGFGIGLVVHLLGGFAPAFHEVKHAARDAMTEDGYQHYKHNAQYQLPVGANIGDLLQAFIQVQPDGRSEEHTSELQSLMRISYAVFCLKKKNKIQHTTPTL